MPSFTRSKRTNAALDYANEGLGHINKALDIKRILKLERDVEYLLLNLVGSKRNWLLQRQNDRCLDKNNKLRPEKSFVDLYGLNFATKQRK
jgi:hypothetical protein